MTRLQRIALPTALPAALLAALLLGACGNSDNGDGGEPGDDQGNSADNNDPGSGSPYNATDVEFAQGMIPHHEQAMAMSALAISQDAGPEVSALAAEIKAAQGPEIETLTSWLAEWGAELPGADEDHAGHGPHADDDGKDHGPGSAGTHHDMAGMLNDERMAELANASGSTFDRLFLELMIEHHEGAVEMAERQTTEGSHGPATDLAKQIIMSQSAEVEQMRELLDMRPN